MSYPFACSDAAKDESLKIERNILFSLPGHVDGVGGGDEGGGDLLHGQAPEDADICDVMALLSAPGSRLCTRFSVEMENGIRLK